MIKVSLKGAAVLLAAAALGGCLSSGPKTPDYKSKDLAPGPSLEIPPDLTRPGRDDRYQVPESPTAGRPNSATASTSAQGAVTPRVDPNEPVVLPEFGPLHMARAGSERWLVVPIPVEKLWPVVREFWQTNGFLLKVESPETGIMQTDWAENRAKLPSGLIRDLLGRYLDSIYSTGERDMFRVRLERGDDPATSEVFFSHRGMVETLTTTNLGNEGQTIWQPRPNDPSLEIEFLRRLMLQLGATEAKVQAVVAEGAVVGSDRAKILKDNAGVAALMVNEPLDRAWRRVGLVLDRAGFSVEDRDRANADYFVRYLDPALDEEAQKNKGFLSSLAFWRSDPKAASEQFHIQLISRGDQGTEVRVVSKEAKTPDANATAATARRIVALLYEQLK